MHRGHKEKIFNELSFVYFVPTLRTLWLKKHF